MSDVTPILFSGPMVRALLDGRKTQTRRVLKVNIGPLPYKTGDLLWVREKAYYGPNRIAYAADNVPIGGRDRVEGWGPARSSIHMPRWASRLTLEVTAVKVERLVEITEEDALAEGFTFHALASGDIPAGAHPIHSFRKLWDSLNAKRGYGWEANPWVCAIAFNVHKMNVDAFLAQREAA